MPRVPVASAEKILKMTGCERVSLEACEELRQIIELESKAIGRKAAAMAKHAGRKTLMVSDVHFVLQQ